MGNDCAVAESVKANSDIYAPLSGEIVAVNDALGRADETGQQCALCRRMLFSIKASDESELNDLVD
ncbi:MAG: hypothetical protein ACR5LD_12210 [Symbiopectobacterium sp.]